MPGFDEVTDVAALREQRWVYERRVERMSYAEIRDLAALPASEGGIGRDLAASTLKQRFRDYVAAMREVETESIDEHRGRELANLDSQERSLKAQTGRVDVEATLLRARVSTGRSMTYDEVVTDAPEAIVLRDERVVVAAAAGLLRVGEARRKLLGLDAPVQTHLEVTHREATLDSLNDARAALGIVTPLKGRKRDRKRKSDRQTA